MSGFSFCALADPASPKAATAAAATASAARRVMERPQFVMSDFSRC
jgi:hypothetical protein